MLKLKTRAHLRASQGRKGMGKSDRGRLAFELRNKINGLSSQRVSLMRRHKSLMDAMSRRGVARIKGSY